MVANPNSFDAGIFCLMLVIGSISIALYSKIGALVLVVAIITFLISGLVVVTGYDVAFSSTKYPPNITTVAKNDTTGRTITTTMTVVTPQNQTTYLIGNGQFPITGNGQLVLGYSLILFSLLLGVIFADQIIKGNWVKGD